MEGVTEEIKEKVSDAWEKTEEKLEDFGEAVKDTAISAKNAIVDTSKKAVDVAEEAAHSITKPWGHPTRQLNEMIHLLKVCNVCAND